LDLRDFVQVIIGAVIQQPDETLVVGAQQNSAILEALQRAYPPGGLVNEIGILHTFVLVLGFGLLIGTGLSTSVFIAAFVVLGVAGGLFALGQLFGVLGVNAAVFTGNMTSALGSLVGHQYLADAYVVFPLLVLGLGLVRWRRMSSLSTVRRKLATNDSMKHYCSFCGSVLKVGYKACHVCDRRIPKKSKGHCTSCGRLVAQDAQYCWFCGEELKADEGGARCPSCGIVTPREARFCPRCGQRLGSPRQEASTGEGPPPEEGGGAEKTDSGSPSP
jgi:RNA polymerase subunit RPABC4/transcription elongation factor Spt4